LIEWFGLQDGKVTDQLEGADAAALTTKVAALAAAAAAAAAPSPAPAAAAAAPQAAAAAQPDQGADVTTRIKSLLSSSPVVLFMKGNAAAPYCGFSRKVVDALRGVGVSSFKDIDIFQDEELRWAMSYNMLCDTCCNMNFSGRAALTMHW
jgi:glutaredoxin-related protein